MRASHVARSIVRIRLDLSPAIGRLFAFGLLLALAACSHAKPLANPLYATIQTDAAEVCAPAGEQLWLSRLRCENGEPVKIVSRETVGTRHTAAPEDQRPLEQLDFGRPLKPGEPDFHLVEQFIVSCGSRDKKLFIDMYHCTENPPEVAPEGMSIVPLKLPDRD